MSDYIKCSELIDFIAGYLSGELPDSERSEFDRHLHVCPPCQTYLKTYEETIRACRAAERGGAEGCDKSMPIPEELVRAIMAARKS